MKLRHLINELEHLKSVKGEEFYEKLLNFDFLVRIINKNNFDIIEETQSIGIYLDDIADECQVIAYLDNDTEINLAGKECN